MPSETAEARDSDFVMLIVSSPSGAGKTTLCNRLRQEFQDIRFSVSHTTRAPRTGELDGREYHFVAHAEFESMIADAQFAEWAAVHGRLYGTSKREIERARAEGGGVLFDIDYQGARQLRAHYPEAVGVFVLPPSLAELERRLRGRGTEDEDATRRRLAAAKLEIAHYGFFDYVVVNDDLDLAYSRLRAVVLAERCRRLRHAHRCEELLALSREPDGGGSA